MNINVSAYMSSIRPYRWMEIYNQLKESDLSFEIVIVGPNEPDYSLPKEIRFFKSDVKPMQCQHAAASFSVGETLLQIVDDIEYGKGAINEMFNTVMSSDNITSTCQYLQDGYSQVYTQNIAGQNLNLAYLPLLPVCGMFRRSAFMQLGGLDCRFNGAMGELDFYMRMKINGYITKFINNFCNENTNFQKKENTSLCGKYWDQDRPKFIELWNTQGVLYPIRNDILRPFLDKDLLNVNQYYGNQYHRNLNGSILNENGIDFTFSTFHKLLKV